MTLFQATERKLPEKAIEKTIEQAEPKELQPWSAAEGLRLCRAMKRYRVSRDEAILTEVQEYFDGWIAAGLPPVRVESTLPMLTLVLLWEENHEPGYAPVIRTWVEGLLALPRSPEGALLTE